MAHQLSILCDGTNPDGTPCTARHDFTPVPYNVGHGKVPPGWWRAAIAVDLPARDLPQRENPLAGGALRSMLDGFRAVADRADPDHEELAKVLAESSTICREMAGGGVLMLAERLGRARGIADKLVERRGDKNSLEILDSLEKSLGALYKERQTIPKQTVTMEITLCGLHTSPTVNADVIDRAAKSPYCPLAMYEGGEDGEDGDIEPLADQPGIS